MRTLQVRVEILLALALTSTCFGCDGSSPTSANDAPGGGTATNAGFGGVATAGANATGGSVVAPGGTGPGSVAGASGAAHAGGSAGQGNGSSGNGGSGNGGSGNGGGGGAVTVGGGAMGGGGAAGAGGGGSSTGALHVNGNVMNDGDGQKVALRGTELVVRWGVYAGLTAAGVDVPWEGGTNNNVGSATIREIGKTKANALRIYGGIGNGLEEILKTAIVEQHMFVGVGRVDWANPQMMATLKKYEKYLFIHPRGEFTHTDSALWRTEALAVVKYIRGLGYKAPIEIGTTGYGQTWSTLQAHGKEVADSDPLKNTLFLLQLYSELANAIPATLNSIAAFGSPVNVGSCLFTSTYGNTPNTYKEVWDQSYAKGLGSFYWDWWGDGEGNSMTSSGTIASLNGIGQYIANDSPAALKNTVKTPFLLNAAVP